MREPFFRRLFGTPTPWRNVVALTRLKRWRCAVKASLANLGLFAEEADAREQTFLGKSPLLFAQVEYARAAREIAEARKRNRTVKLK
jgi:hypothetical protein